MVSNFNSVREQYIAIAPLAKKLYLIGRRGLAAEISCRILRLLIAPVLGWKRIG
ncbi:MAG: hypothetical protein M3044_05775 [Thermoproteota archaeon]|nr:hypothetical protein [Thermoproteota archaeon]